MFSNWKKSIAAVLLTLCLAFTACGAPAAVGDNVTEPTGSAPGTGAQTGTETSGGAATPIDVYVLAGQSNMAGTSRLNLLPEQYRRTYPRVKMYFEVGSGYEPDMREWTVVQPGQGAFINNTQYFGPELGMAEVLQNSDSEIAFVKYAYGGTAIYQHPGINNTATNKDNWHGSWDGATPGRLYNGLISTVQTALTELEEQGYAPVIRGMAWMQGETDGEIQFNSGEHAAADVYEHNLTEFFKAVRTELNVPDMPIVFGEIYEYSTAVIQARKIVLAQKRVAETLPGTYLINTGDLVIDGSIDDWHWNGISEWLLGVRFGEKLYEVTHPALDNTYNDGEAAA